MARKSGLADLEDSGEEPVGPAVAGADREKDGLRMHPLDIALPANRFQDDGAAGAQRLEGGGDVIGKILGRQEIREQSGFAHRGAMRAQNGTGEAQLHVIEAGQRLGDDDVVQQARNARGGNVAADDAGAGWPIFRGKIGR